MQPQALFFAVRFTVILAILTIAAAVVTANACHPKCFGEDWSAMTADDVRQWIADGGDVTDTDDYLTPLHVAAEVNPNSEVIAILITAGANPNQEALRSNGKTRGTPIHRAIFNSNPGEIIKALVKGGADINVKDKHGNAAVHWAAGYARGINDAKAAIILPLLAENEADLHAKNKAGNSALYFSEAQNFSLATDYLRSVGVK